jgi:hypothetical protein
MPTFFMPSNMGDYIFILGSYHTEQNHPILKNLQKYLRSKGFTNVFLASDIELYTKADNMTRNQQIYEKVENLLKRADFCFFILFPKHNESVKTELITYLKSNFESKRGDKYLILPPRDLEIDSMLEGLFDQQAVKIFRYWDVSEINKKCFDFIIYQ